MENLATLNNATLVLNAGDRFRYFNRSASLLDIEIVKVYTIENDPVDTVWATCRRLERPELIDEYPRLIIEDLWERIE